jgi:predicted Ser/Thr protein kinase
MATTMSSTSGDVGLDETVAPTDVGAPAKLRSQASPGRGLGRYQLIERIGAGAMGVVWRAEDRELGRKVALKLLKRPDQSLTERLIREAQAMAQVSHPNVVTVFEVSVADGDTYIAMELVDGKSLRSWQANKGHTVPEIVEAYIAAGRGLAAAHAAGIIHRDFKPDNVLVGNDERVRVTDFGLAASKPTASGIAPQIGDVNLTTSGSVLGTPAYMAPEQFTGGNVDPRTDQFNFCVALYEALYGERPFEGKTFPELADNVCDGKVKPPPAGSHVSGALRAIVLKGLAVRPGDRFPTMDHLLTELGRDRARPWRRTAIAAAAVAAALALGLVADWAVRDRVEGEIRQSFRATGKQIVRAVGLQAKRFRAGSNLVSQFKVMLDVTSHHDQADFGLATPEQDTQDLQLLHDTLMSADWQLVRELGQESQSQLAVVDYKGRLLYTSAAPTEWNGNLKPQPLVARALAASKGDFLSTIRYDEPSFTAAKLFGPKPPSGLALVFARTLDHAGEAGGVFLQFIDGREVLEGIRLDDTRLGLVTLDGTSIGEVPSELIAAAPPTGEIAETMSGGTSYQVQARAIEDLGGRPIGRVVMARPLASVLTLFPGARVVFALAMVGALALAILTAVRARRITGARV